MLKSSKAQPRPVGILHWVVSSDVIVLIGCVLAVPAALWVA